MCTGEDEAIADKRCRCRRSVPLPRSTMRRRCVPPRHIVIRHACMPTCAPIVAVLSFRCAAADHRTPKRAGTS